MTLKVDLSRSSPTTLTSSPIWVIGISLFSTSAVFEVTSEGSKHAISFVCVCKSLI
jgi:hypothetical protein